MALLPSIEELSSNGKKGDWAFVQDTHLAVKYDETEWGVVILPIKVSPSGQKPWEWNGSRESPTLSPSILVHGSKDGNIPRWHGWLREGILVEA